MSGRLTSTGTASWCALVPESGRGWQDGRVPPTLTITPLFVADLLAEGERMPVYVHVIDHPDARVLVDTGMTELHRRWPTSIPASVP